MLSARLTLSPIWFYPSAPRREKPYLFFPIFQFFLDVFLFVGSVLYVTFLEEVASLSSFLGEFWLSCRPLRMADSSNCTVRIMEVGERKG